MQFANYTDFRSAVLKMVDGDDVSTSFSTATLDLLIGLAEMRVYRDLRASTMLSDLSVAVTDNEVTLPSDLQELREVYFSGEPPIEIIPLDRMRRLQEADASSGNVQFAAQDGDTLTFWPQASGTLLGTYYKRPTVMAEESTWANQTTLARYPELFLFASMIEVSPFIGEDQRIGIWEQKYGQALENARHNERWRAYGGSPLRIRAR